MRTMKKIILIFCLAALMMGIFTAGFADNEYGITETRVRVRSTPSLNGEIIDNLLEDRCVFIRRYVQNGNLMFIGVDYINADGETGSGWVAQKEGNKEYVFTFGAEQFSNEFGLPLGMLPEETAGTRSGVPRINIDAWQESAQSVNSASSEPVKTSSEVTDTTDSAESSSTQKETVMYVQQALKEMGIYYGDITGNIGTITTNSIKAFQRRVGLNATGELDETTLRMIREKTEGKSEPESSSENSYDSDAAVQNQTDTTWESGTLSLDSTGDLVLEVQKRLAQLGYYSGDITGHYGSKTEAAVRKYQKAVGLSATGNADASTIQALLYGNLPGSSQATAASSTTEEQSDTRTYSVGDRADVISEMQQILRGMKLYSGDITGHFGTKTRDAVIKFQKQNGLSQTGTLDPATIAALRNGGSGSEDAAQNPGDSADSANIYSLDWFTAKENGVFSKIGFVKGNYATLTDVATGKSLRVYIQSAGYHLDVEPATSSDTATLCSIFNVSSASAISYVRRPAVITSPNGYRIACSIYGQPHGQQVITNNSFNGQFCLHFLNSRTSGSYKVDADHQAAIQKAINANGGSAKTIRTASDL